MQEAFVIFPVDVFLDKALLQDFGQFSKAPDMLVKVA